MKTTGRLALFSCVLALSVSPLTMALPEYTTPTGLWISFDVSTNKPFCYIRITEENGLFSGRVEKVLVKKRERCTACTGTNKSRMIEGMEILWDMQQDGDEYGNGFMLSVA